MRESDWIRDVFIDKAHLFIEVLRRKGERGRREAEALARLLEKHGVPRGGRVVELGCGNGRVAVPLAVLGFRVTCLDVSRVFLEEAARLAEDMGVSGSVEVVEGDAWRVDELLPANEFDAAYMIWTTLIGYYPDKERDLVLLQKVYRVVRPGGILAVLNTVSRDLVVARRLCAERDMPVVSEWDDLVVIEHPEFDGVRSLLKNRWEYYRRVDGDLKFLGEHEFTLRIYSVNELVELAEEAGWTFEAAYHRLDTLEPYIPGRSGINIVFRRPR